jgi:hypothetical protein
MGKTPHKTTAIIFFRSRVQVSHFDHQFISRFVFLFKQNNHLINPPPHHPRIKNVGTMANPMGTIADAPDELKTATLMPALETSFSLLNNPKGEDNESDTISLAGTHYSGTSHLASSFGDRSGSAEDPARPAYVDPVVAEHEERQVKRSRLVVIAVLVVSLAILASTMYLIVSRGEHETFEKQVSLIEFRRLCWLILWDNHPAEVPKISQNSPQTGFLAALLTWILVRSAPTTPH